MTTINLGKVVGDDGRGVVSILKTGTQGLVDTYTITYTDNTTSTFEVKNGANGQDGASGTNGQDGEDGRGIVSIEKTGTEGLVDTYTITYTDNTTSTYQVTNGSGGGGGTANYNELENKPSINNVSLQGNKSLSDLGVQPAGNYLTTETDPVFSASASANIATSDITNWNGKQEALVSGTNIKTINNQSLLGSGNITIEGGGGSSLPISFSETQPPLDGSVVLWINANAEEPVVDEFSAFALAGTCTNLSVEDQTELYSRQYQANATGTNSLYNIFGIKNGSTPISKVELASIGGATTDFLVVGCNLSATAQGDLSTLLLYGVSTGQNMGFEIPVRGTTQGQYSNNPTVEGTFSDKTKAYVFESRAVTSGFKVTATRVDTGELEVTWTYENLHSTYAPCFGFGKNTSGNIAWKFKKVV